MPLLCDKEYLALLHEFQEIKWRRKKEKTMNILYINGGSEQRGKKQREKERISKKRKRTKKIENEHAVVYACFA